MLWTALSSLITASSFLFRWSWLCDALDETVKQICIFSCGAGGRT
jgi:hypothetical protein